MRRIFLASASMLTVLASIGCKATTGQCDCNGTLAPLHCPSNPYTVVGPSISGSAGAPVIVNAPTNSAEPMPMPMNPMPMPEIPTAK